MEKANKRKPTETNPEKNQIPSTNKIPSANQATKYLKKTIKNPELLVKKDDNTIPTEVLMARQTHTPANVVKVVEEKSTFNTSDFDLRDAVIKAAILDRPYK